MHIQCILQGDIQQLHEEVTHIQWLEDCPQPIDSVWSNNPELWVVPSSALSL